MKPATKIILITSVLLAGGVAVYLLWGRIASRPTEAPTGTLPAGGSLPIVPAPAGGPAPEETEGYAPGASGSPEAGSGAALTKVSDFPVFDAWVNRGNNEVFYLTPTGKVYLVRSGPDTEVGRQAVVAVNEVTPAPDGSRALVIFGDPRNKSWGVFDSVDKTWRPLPGIPRAAGWIGGSSEELFALIASGTLSSLVRVDLSTSPISTQTLVADLRLRDVTIMSRTPNEVLFLDRPSALLRGRLWRYDTAERTLNLLLEPASGLMAAPSNDGKLIYAWRAPNEFLILNETLGEAAPLFFSTFPEKCGGDATTTYCFVPQTTEGAGLLPDSYLIGNFRTNDRLFRVSFLEETAENILVSGGVPLDAIRVIPVANRLYVVNAADRGLYEIRLAE